MFLKGLWFFLFYWRFICVTKETPAWSYEKKYNDIMCLDVCFVYETCFMFKTLSVEHI
jgi:hypothetical protein